MDQLRLGSTGVHVSRLALGMMSYGDQSSRDWILGEETAEPVLAPCRLQAQSYGSPGDADVIDAVISLSSERGVPPEQIALAWLLHRPGVTGPIVGATKLGHIDDALAAAKLELSAGELALLDAPYLPHRVI